MKIGWDQLNCRAIQVVRSETSIPQIVLSSISTRQTLLLGNVVIHCVEISLRTVKLSRFELDLPF